MKKNNPPRKCGDCGVEIPHGCVCPPCWEGLRAFRRYLREVLDLEPIYGDHPPGLDRVVIYAWPNTKPPRSPA